MKIFSNLLFICIILSYNFLCSNSKATPPDTSPNVRESTSDSLLYQRFPPPPGFQRTPADLASFASYLRNLPLKPPNTLVLLYDGREKRNQNAHVAVVNLPIGKKDLHQCADAIIRLRAEYLWHSKQYKKIHFNLTNGFRVDYERWRKGGRVKVTGNKTEWVQTAAASDAAATFWKYLEFVFSYAGTLSLSRELQSVPMSDIQIGDVLIQGGSPGHAVLVVDMAADVSGKKIYLLAQSYMPAQEIQILKNPEQPDGQPWYTAGMETQVITPEWDFSAGDLKRFSFE